MVPGNNTREGPGALEGRNHQVAAAGPSRAGRRAKRPLPWQRFPGRPLLWRPPAGCSLRAAVSTPAGDLTVVRTAAPRAAGVLPWGWAPRRQLAGSSAVMTVRDTPPPPSLAVGFAGLARACGRRPSHCRRRGEPLGRDEQRSATFYSSRSASMGSSRAARHAGIALAASATTVSAAPASAYVRASVAVTP